jgi:cholesterol transport system auxiliary component
MITKNGKNGKNGVRVDFQAPPMADAHTSARKSTLTPFLLPFLLALLVSACSLTRESPVKDTYLLEPAMPPAVAKPQPMSVRVATVSVAAPFRGRNFVYRTGALKYETDFYVEFLVPPQAMLTEQTSRALEAAHVFARVVPPGSGGESDVTLEGFASALYADARSGSPASAELAIAYYLFPSFGGGSTPVWSHEYRRHVDLTAQTPAAYATALNSAFGEILAELTKDLAEVQIPKP